MFYTIVLLLSFLVTALAFANEINRGNIIHIQNGRAPNAGAAIFPSFPLYQIAAVLAALLLSHVVGNYAFGVVITAEIIISLRMLIQFKRSERLIRALKKEHNIQ